MHLLENIGFFPFQKALAIVFQGNPATGISTRRIFLTFSEKIQWFVPELRLQVREKLLCAPHGDGLVQEFHLFPRQHCPDYSTDVIEYQ